MTWHQFLRGRRSTLDRWSGKIAKRIGTRPSALHSTFHFPTLTCGVFVFSSVSAPRPPPPPSRPPSSLTHTLTHSHSLTLTHSHSLTLTHTHSHSLTHTHSLSLTHTHPHTHTHSLTLTHSHTLTLTQGVGCTPRGSAGVPGSPPLLRGRRGTMCTAKGLDVRPGVPWGSAAFAWQAWDNVHCQRV